LAIHSGSLCSGLLHSFCLRRCQTHTKLCSFYLFVCVLHQFAILYTMTGGLSTETCPQCHLAPLTLPKKSVGYYSPDNTDRYYQHVCFLTHCVFFDLTTIFLSSVLDTTSHPRRPANIFTSPIPYKGSLKRVLLGRIWTTKVRAMPLKIRLVLRLQLLLPPPNLLPIPLRPLLPGKPKYASHAPRSLAATRGTPPVASYFANRVAHRRGCHVPHLSIKSLTRSPKIHLRSLHYHLLLLFQLYHLYTLRSQQLLLPLLLPLPLEPMHVPLIRVMPPSWRPGILLYIILHITLRCTKKLKPTPLKCIGGTRYALALFFFAV
jgi:hypothetical protein